jgi:MFS family permease
MSRARDETGVPGGRVYGWAVVGLLWLVCFFSYADRQALFSVFPLLRRDLGLTTVQLGLLGSSFAVVYGLGAPLAGYVVDRIRRKTAIVGGLELWSAICMVSALSRTFGQLLLLRASEGLGETIFYPAALSMVSDYHGRRTRSRAMGILQTGVYAGTVGGGYWAGVLAERHGWRIALFGFGAMGCVLGLVLVRAMREPVRGSADDVERASGARVSITGDEIRDLLRNRALLALMGAFACANFVAVVLLTWMPMYLYSRFGLSLAHAAFDATVYPQVASIGGSLCGGYFADLLAVRSARGRMWVQCVGVLAGAPCVALSGLAPSLKLAIVGLVCWGFCKGIYDSNIFAAAFEVVPVGARGTASGLMNCVGWLLGGGAAPVTIGFVAGYLSLGYAIALSALVYLLAAVGLFFAGSMMRRKPQAEVQGPVYRGVGLE